MRVIIMRPSRSQISSFLLVCLALVLFGGLQRVNAQTATPTRTPTPTHGATNTPSIQTATAVATADNTGCPDEPVSPDGLDPSWAVACVRCIASRPTPVATIQSFILGTVPPIGTVIATTPLPTIPPMYELATLAPTSTSTPAVTATSAPSDYYYDYDLRIDPEYAVIGDYPSACVGGCGSWSSGEGMIGHYDSGVDHQWIYWRWIGRDWTNVKSISIWKYDGWLAFDHMFLNCNIEVCGESSGHTVPSDLVVDPDVSGGHIASFIFSDPYPTIEEVSEFGSVHAVTAHYGIYKIQIVSAYPQDFGDPTATPAVTSTPASTPISCSVPAYYDVADPVAGISFGDDELGENCYTILPEINITATDPDIVFDGLELCLQWKALPVVSLLGITFQIDLLLIIPAAYIVRRMFSF